MLGDAIASKHLPRDVIQFDISRAIVSEKPELLSDPAAKTIKIKQHMDLNGVNVNIKQENGA